MIRTDGFSSVQGFAKACALRAPTTSNLYGYTPSVQIERGFQGKPDAVQRSAESVPESIFVATLLRRSRAEVSVECRDDVTATWECARVPSEEIAGTAMNAPPDGTGLLL
jgi:hypothetical protein